MRLVLVVPLLCLALAACATVDPTHDHGVPGSLRAVVFARYDELAANHALPNPNSPEAADFSDVVAPFLPHGMPMADASALLARNGFGVHPLPSDAHDAEPPPLAAGLQVANWTLVGRADVNCRLTPSTSGGTLAAAHCRLYVAML